MSQSPIVRAFFDRPTGSLQYVFHDPDTRKGAIVDDDSDDDEEAVDVRGEVE